MGQRTARDRTAALALALSFTMLPALSAPNAHAADNRHQTLVCRTNEPSGSYEPLECRRPECRLKCHPPHPRPLTLDCSIPHPCPKRCDEDALKPVRADCKPRNSGSDCHPLSIYHRLAALGCGFEKDAFWVHPDTNAQSFTLARGKPGVVEIGWDKRTCRLDQRSWLLAHFVEAPLRREDIYQEFLRRGCNFSVENPYDSGGLEWVTLTQAMSADARDNQPVRQPKISVRFWTDGVRVPDTSNYFGLLQAPHIECIAPSYTFDRQTTLICTSSGPLNGTYSILNREAPYIIRDPAGQLGDLDFIWTEPVVKIREAFSPPPLISLLQEPYIVLDPTGQIGYLGFIWTGPVMKTDVLNPPPTSTIQLSPPEPTAHPSAIIFAGLGTMGLGALILEIAKRLLARAAQRAQPEIKEFVYGDRLNDISVRVIPQDDYRIHPNHRPDDWPT